MNTTTPLRTDENRDERRAFWLMHVERQKQSQLKQKAYCQQTGINYNSFVYWKSVFSSQSEQPKKCKKAFAKVKIVQQTTIEKPTQQRIQIRLTNGHIVYIPIDMDPARIATLIHHLGSSYA